MRLKDFNAATQEQILKKLKVNRNEKTPNLKKIIQEQKEIVRNVAFLCELKEYGIEPIQEFLFAKQVFGRRWRSDYYFEYGNIKIAIEQEGGGGTGGRHTRFEGYHEDMQKYNTYTALGIKLLRFTPSQISKNPKKIAKIIYLALNEKDFSDILSLLYAC